MTDEPREYDREYTTRTEMARDQDPVSEEAIAALREEMAAQREEIREALAEDLGGEPEDYTGRRNP